MGASGCGIRFPATGARILGRANRFWATGHAATAFDAAVLPSTADAPAFVQGSGLRAASLGGSLNGRSINARRGVQLAPSRGVTYSHARLYIYNGGGLMTLTPV